MNFFDLHCDTPFEIYQNDCLLDDRRLAVSARFASNFNRWIVCSAIWIKEGLEEPFLLYQKILKNFQNRRQQFGAKSYQSILAVEGGSLIEDDFDRIERIYQDGVRLMSLTWNGENNLAGGVHSNKELTAFGKRLLFKMNDLKMVCDLSHLNEKSFYSAAYYAVRPIVSHTCCRAVHSHPRNLTDRQLQLIAEKRGLVGLCFYPEFLGSKNVFEQLYLHIDHCLQQGLEQILAIGSDFDGATMSPQLKNAGQIKDLYQFLLKKGIQKGTLENIFFKNAYNFFSSL